MKMSTNNIHKQKIRKMFNIKQFIVKIVPFLMIFVGKKKKRKKP